jgi:hypothetical protein
MFQGSKASDYNEGTWGNNMSNIEDENKLDDAAAAAKLKAENERRELAGLPPKADPNAEKEKEGQQGAAEGANPAEPAAAAGANAGEAGANPAAAGEGGANAGEAGANAGEAGEGAEANPDAPEGGANAPAAEGGLGAPQGGAPPREEEARQAAGANAGEGGANAGEEAGANPAPAQPAAEGQQPQPQGAPGVGGVQAQGAPQQQVPQQAAAAGAGEGAAVGGGMQVAPPLAQPSPQGQANQRGASLQEPFDYDNSTTAQINENTQQILNSKTHESELMTPTERTEIEEEARRRNAEFAHTRDHMHTSFYMNNPRFPEMKGKYVRPFGEAEYDAMPEQRNNFDNPPKGAIKEDANGIPYIKTPFGPLQAYDKDNPKAENANKYKELLKKMSINMQSGNEIEARATYEQLSRMQRGIHLNDTERVKEAGGTFKSLKDTITNEVSDDSKSISDVDGTLKKAQEAYFSLPERLRDKEHQGTSLREEMRMIEAIARRGEKDKGGRLSDAFDVMGGTGYKDDYEPKTAREPLHDGRYIFSRQSHRERGNDALIEGTNVGAAIGAPAAAAARPAPADEGNPYDVNRIEIPDFNFFGGMFG